MKYSVKFEQTAFYRTSHVVKRSENELVFALHGYGQLSEFFLNKLEPIFSDDRLFVVPEATNYHYLKGYTGRVGANWMTSHEREEAIANNHRFLNAILDSFLVKFKVTPKITVLGFSQGAATATRWVGQLRVPVDRVVLWSGAFAHDLEVGNFYDRVQNGEVLMVWGKADEMITPEAIQKQEDLVRGLPFEVQRIQFDGGHELHPPTLLDVFRA